MRLKNEPLATVARGFLLPEHGGRYSMPTNGHEVPVSKNMTHHHPGRHECPLTTCAWEPWRLPSRCLLRPAALLSHRRNTTPALPTPKSRSATSCRTRAPHPLMA